MKTLYRLLMLLFVAALLAPAGARAGWDANEDEEAANAVAYFKKRDASLSRFFDKAYAYVVFPDVYKGGFLILGGGHGGGYAFEMGRLVGRSSITQINIGPQLGGQAFSEIIFFKDKPAFDKFKKGNFELSAQMTAVVVTLGAATNTDYSNGVAIFVLPKAGLMADVTVGGQRFTYEPENFGGAHLAQPPAEAPQSFPAESYAPQPAVEGAHSYDPAPLEKEGSSGSY